MYQVKRQLSLLFLFTTTIFFTVCNSSNAQLRNHWLEPSSGSYGDANNWFGNVPGHEDEVLFGANVETSSGQVAVQFDQHETIGAGGVVSGDYEFQFLAPNLTYSVDGFFVIGENRLLNNITADLPSTASLLVGNTIFPGTFEATLVTIGGSYNPNSTFAPTSSGVLTVTGEGTRVHTFIEPDSDIAWVQGRINVGGFDNSGQLNVFDGAVVDAEDVIFVGGGVSRGISSGQTLTAEGEVVVRGRGPTGNRSTLSADYGIFVGTLDTISDTDRIGRSLGTLTVEDGGRVITDRIGVGDHEDGDRVISNAELGLPPDRINIRREFGSNFQSASRVAARELTLGIDAVFDLGFGAGSSVRGGVATLGNVSENKINSFETLYIGDGGELQGEGEILGHVRLLEGGLINPGYSHGKVTIGGSLVAEAGEILFEIASPNPGVDFDQVVVSGDALVNATLRIEFVDYSPSANEEFDLFDVAGVESFAGTSIEVSGLPNGAFATFNDGVVSVSGLLLGDVDRDGVVNFSDLPGFIALLFNGVFQDEGDIDRNGLVNFSDIGPFISLLVSQ